MNFCDREIIEFEFTVTTRLDSDSLWNYFQVVDIQTRIIVAPSKEVEWEEPDKNFTDKYLLNFVKEKSKDLVWIVSDCIPPSNRQFLIQEIQDYMNVDIYGKCGNLR